MLLSRAIYSKYRDIPPRQVGGSALPKDTTSVAWPGIEPATFRLIAQFPNRSAT